MYKIELEDVIANAFIKSAQNGENKSFISYTELEIYAKNVKLVLESQNEIGILRLSRNKTIEVLNKYSEYFEEDIKDGIRGIKLKCKNYESLVDKFRGYLPLKLLLAYDKAQLI